MSNSLFILMALIVVFYPVNSRALEPSKYDKRAQSVARHLQAPKFGKGSEKDLAGVKATMIALIEELETSQRTSGASPDSTLSKAFQFRDTAIGRNQAMVSTTSILSVWKTASALGLFNGIGKYTGTISKGRGVGEQVAFEYIVPPEVNPEFTKYIGNVRIVTLETKREKGAELSNRDSEFLNALNQVKSEAETRERMLSREDSKVEEDREAMSHDLYLKEVKAAGDMVDRAPSIKLEGTLAIRPSKKSKNRYRLDAKMTNASRHPTEIQLEVYLLGFTDKLNEIYVMKYEKTTEKLRTSESRIHEIWTQDAGSYAEKVWVLDGKPMEGKRKLNRVIYKGYVMIATFKDKGVVGIAASDARLMAYATGDRTGLSSFPKF